MSATQKKKTSGGADGGGAFGGSPGGEAVVVNLHYPDGEPSLPRDLASRLI